MQPLAAQGCAIAACAHGNMEGQNMLHRRVVEMAIGGQFHHVQQIINPIIRHMFSHPIGKGGNGGVGGCIHWQSAAENSAQIMSDAARTDNHHPFIAQRSQSRAQGIMPCGRGIAIDA